MEVFFCIWIFLSSRYSANNSIILISPPLVAGFGGSYEETETNVRVTSIFQGK
jgi:hypothetical protein